MRNTPPVRIAWLQAPCDSSTARAASAAVAIAPLSSRTRANMMRAHPPSHACGSPVLWFLGLLAAVVVLVQASWLNSLRASLDNYRALANSSAFTLLDNGSVA